MLIVGVMLILVDPTRHVLLDHDGVFFKPEFLSMYNYDGSLSPTGRTCQMFTIAGLVLLFTSICWFMNLGEEFYKLFGGVPLEK
mmetsp:Transcript_110810/g.201314  ORF Transcript_110810/g.201314 Transcript_110810/m.201314 type:complete len:84 (+) Transcript_110810:985-1236(+)